MKEKLKRLLVPVLGYAVITLLVLAVFAVLALFCGAVMRVLGFQYRSVGSFLLFFALSALLGFPAEVLAKALPRALLHLGKIRLPAAKVLFVCLDALSTALFMRLVDLCMPSVTANWLSLLAVALLLALGCVSDLDRPAKKD